MCASPMLSSLMLLQCCKVSCFSNAVKSHASPVLPSICFPNAIKSHAPPVLLSHVSLMLSRLMLLQCCKASCFSSTSKSHACPVLVNLMLVQCCQVLCLSNAVNFHASPMLSNLCFSRAVKCHAYSWLSWFRVHLSFIFILSL